MEAIFINNDKILLELPEEELLIICNALNEVSSCVKNENFEKIIGVPLKMTQSYLHDLIDAYIKIKAESIEI